MHRVTIWYEVPADPDAFDRRYVEDHVPLVLEVPGLRSFTYSRVRPLGGEQSVHLVAELDFEDHDAARTGLSSPQMARAAADADAMGVPRTMFRGEVTTTGQ